MHANRPAVALTERATVALPPNPILNRALADPLLRASVVDAAAYLNYRLV